MCGFVYPSGVWFAARMSTELIEKEVADLKERVALLEQSLGARESQPTTAEILRPKAKDTWRKIVGSVKDSELHREAMRLGAEWRAQMNAEGR